MLTAFIAALISLTPMQAPASQHQPKPPKAPAWIVQAIKDGKRCEAYEPMFKAHGLPWRQFTFLAWRESRCRRGAVNAIWKKGRIVWTLNKDGSFDSGLLQINSSWKTVTSQVCHAPYGDLRVLLDPVCNVEVAKYLYDRGGLAHWGL